MLDVLSVRLRDSEGTLKALNVLKVRYMYFEMTLKVSAGLHLTFCSTTRNDIMLGISCIRLSFVFSLVMFSSSVLVYAHSLS